MKKTFLKHYILINFAILMHLTTVCKAIPSRVFMQKTKNDLSGTWKINEQLSKFVNAPRTVGYYLIKIIQNKDSIIISRSGNNSVIQKMAVDGRILKQRFDSYGRVKSTVISWNSQNTEMALTATFVYDKIPLEPYQKKYIETWSLSENGKELTIIRKMEASDPKMNGSTKSVYDKQD